MRQVVVQGLLFSAGWQELKDLTRPFGNVSRADIAMGADGRSKGWGTVLFDDPRDAAAAIHVRPLAESLRRCTYRNATWTMLCDTRSMPPPPTMRTPRETATLLPNFSWDINEPLNISCTVMAWEQSARVRCSGSQCTPL